MSSLRYSFRCLRDVRLGLSPQWRRPVAATAFCYRARKNPQTTARSLSTTRPRSAPTDDNEFRHSAGSNESVSANGMDLQTSEPGSQADGTIKLAFARPVPLSPSYFSRTPTFNDSYVIIQDLARRYGRLPVVPREQAQPTAWRSKENYRLAVGEHVKGRDYAECMKLVKRLHLIHPDLKPQEVIDGLVPFQREVNPYLNRPKPIPMDKFGRALGVGKRKSSIARAWVVEGTGEVLINGKPLSDAFGRIHDRESAVWALKSTDRMDKYNVWALVHGGGTTGQAEALALAVAKALVTHEPALKNPLRRAGCITRDPRVVERKKTGHVKARKMPTWTKR